MASVAGILGLNFVIRNLIGSQQRLAVGLQRGLKRAGLKLQRESQKLVPIETGALKASAYTRAFGAGFSTKVAVGYTAAYALPVHEAVAMKLKGQLRGAPEGHPGYRGRYWDPQGKAQAKFLEQPARRMARQLRQEILFEMRFGRLP
jgi:hypothetical protein